MGEVCREVGASMSRIDELLDSERRVLLGEGLFSSFSIFTRVYAQPLQAGSS